MNVGFNGRRDCLLPGLNHEFASCKDEFPLPLLELIQALIFAVTLRSHVPMEYLYWKGGDTMTARGEQFSWCRASCGTNT